MPSPNLLDLITLTLATYYLAITITKLHGPGALAERLRHAVYRWRGFRPALNGDWYDPARPHPALGRALTIDDDWVAAGISCPLCASLYVAAMLALILALLPGARPLVDVLAVAGGASLLFSLGRTWS